MFALLQCARAPNCKYNTSKSGQGISNEKQLPQQMQRTGARERACGSGTGHNTLAEHAHVRETRIQTQPAPSSRHRHHAERARHPAQQGAQARASRLVGSTTRARKARAHAKLQAAAKRHATRPANHPGIMQEPGVLAQHLSRYHSAQGFGSLPDRGLMMVAAHVFDHLPANLSA